MSDGAAARPISFDPEEARALFAAGRYDDLSARFLEFLDASEAVSFDALPPDRLLLLDRFALSLLYIFVQAGFVPNGRDAIRFIDHNQTIANLVALSSIRTTDAALRQLLDQPRNLGKILTLYSPRNEMRLDAARFFDADPGLATRWWFSFVGNEYGKLASRNALDHLRLHFARWDPRMSGLHFRLNEAYFGATYVAPGAVERAVKRNINELVRRDWAKGITVRNRPNRRKAAVISGTWQETHSCYRSTHRFVEALAQRFDLTFVALAGRPYVRQGFAEVIEAPAIENALARIADNDFQLVFYPEIGMSIGTIMLANLRLAPIQISALGHSASSFGADIDYCVSGCDAERADLLAENYSERAILVPGIGLSMRRIEPPRPVVLRPAEPVVVNCQWSAPKTTYEMLRRLRHIREAVRRPVLFQLFPAAGLRNSGYPLFVREVVSAVGEDCVRVFPALNQPDYFQQVAQAHLSIESFPFGAINTLIDSLYFGIPFVCWEGSRAFNRFASGFCRANGLSDLVATDEASWFAKVIRLIDDDDYRARIHAKCAAVDLAATAFAYDPGPAFLKAVDYIVENHAALKASRDRVPIIVK